MKKENIPNTEEILSSLKEFNTKSGANITDDQLKSMAETMYTMACENTEQHKQNALIAGLIQEANARGLRKLIY